MQLTGISLFAGAVDGIGIAFEMAGIRITHAVEYDTWRAERLQERCPHTIVMNEDIANVERLPYADVLFGGVPCQPWSNAGERRGTDDDRHLWPEMRRIAGIVRPRVVLVENVSGAVSGGLVDEICSDLEADGYTCWAAVFPACVFGAPHERYRTWIVAYAEKPRCSTSGAIRHIPALTKFNDTGKILVNASRTGLSRRVKTRVRTDSTQTGAGLVTGHKRSGTSMVNASRAGRQKQQSTTITSHKRHAARRPDTVGRKRLHKRGMGGAADGLASVVRDFPGFPAGQGPHQYDYEPPRTIPKQTPENRQWVKALGDAVVPQQALPLAQGIADWLRKVAQ